MEIGAALALVLLLAGDEQRVLAGLDVEVVLVEPGERDGDAVGVFAGLLDVVGRIALRPVIETTGRFEQPAEMIEADGGTVKR